MPFDPHSPPPPPQDVDKARAAAKKSRGKDKDEVPRTVLDELRHPNPMIQSHLNALEAVMKRAALVEAAYETDVLFAAYRQQAAAFNRDVSQKVRFLEGCGVSD